MLEDLRRAIVEEYPVGLTHVVNGCLRQARGERRRESARSEGFDIEIRGDDSAGSLRHGQSERHGPVIVVPALFRALFRKWRVQLASSRGVRPRSIAQI